MVCLGFEPKTAVWLAQTNPLSYGAPYAVFYNLQNSSWLGEIARVNILFQIYTCAPRFLKMGQPYADMKGNTGC